MRIPAKPAGNLPKILSITKLNIFKEEKTMKKHFYIPYCITINNEIDIETYRFLSNHTPNGYHTTNEPIAPKSQKEITNSDSSMTSEDIRAEDDSKMVDVKFSADCSSNVHSPSKASMTIKRFSFFGSNHRPDNYDNTSNKRARTSETRLNIGREVQIDQQDYNSVMP
jgi:hypothetical protein